MRVVKTLAIIILLALASFPIHPLMGEEQPPRFIEPRLGNPYPALPGMSLNITLTAHSEASEWAVEVYSIAEENGGLTFLNYSLQVEEAWLEGLRWKIQVRIPDGIRPALYWVRAIYKLAGGQNYLEEPESLWILDRWPDELTILQLTDTHIGYQAESSTRTLTGLLMAKLLNASIILITGDVTDTATNSQAQEFRFLLLNYSRGNPKFIIPGNHDRKTEAYEKYIGDRNYAVDIGSFFILGLDTGDEGYIGPELIEWANRTLRSMMGRTKIVMFHHPLFDGSIHGTLSFNGTLERSWLYSSWRGVYEYASRLLNILIESNVTIVLSGHIHTDRILQFKYLNRTIYFVTTSTTGAGRPEYNGVRLLRVGRDGSVEIRTPPWMGLEGYPNSIPVEPVASITSAGEVRLTGERPLFSSISSSDGSSLSLSLNFPFDWLKLGGRVILPTGGKASKDAYALYLTRVENGSSAQLLDSISVSGLNYFLVDLRLPGSSRLLFTLSSFKDIHPPSASIAYMVPSTPSADSPITVYLQSRDEGWGVLSVILREEFGDKRGFKDHPANKERGDLYSVRLPGYPPGSNITLTCIALDAALLEGRSQPLTISLPPPPAPSFSLKELNISKEEVEPNEEISIKVTLANVGNAQGSHRVSLKVNGTELQGMEVELPPGKEKLVEFKLRLEKVGSYIIDVDGLSRSLKVSQPPQAQPLGFPVQYTVFAVTLASVIAALALYMARRKR
ncbi:metallophosphoesterase [Candidatus Bathyarchaeota archaeon]|nr:metallophosphoesterase [Candidatus Bathyarchaeota archaeon]